MEIGGFGGHPDHDSHLLYTLSAIQILALYPDEGIFKNINVDKVVTCRFFLPQHGQG